MEFISLGFSTNSFGVCLYISKRWGLKHPCCSCLVFRFWLFIICGVVDVQICHVTCVLAVLAGDKIALCHSWARQSGACGQRLLFGPAFVLVVCVVGQREQHQLFAGGKRLAKRPCDRFKTHSIGGCSLDLVLMREIIC